ncbi:MAG: uracil-DNA glycosylase [Gammaproteobacteria bacterium]|nr:uracil-DNA glycosylase [Gammaproteobacteria bacterium]MBU0785796.1 uracil-DNA glycosylase [Gammaproteobacteria bacterium]MBU0815707.1 uracil-DNA glycosylase [Gammaproteobacteria bacterium]MBU1788284.1 uracil-DNA glycosylase [Gammaproteobacteria bacterium]
MFADAPCLTAWAPRSWPVAQDWRPVVDRFLATEAAVELETFIRQRLDAGATIYPSEPFRALALTPLSRVRVVILGQDPYHGPGQAEGLAFSVAPGVRLPPSLRNIFKEIARDGGEAVPANGSLAQWAAQGVLLLNTCLTVEQSQPASHAKFGWQVLTNLILEAVQDSANPVVFMLWGAHAQSLGGVVARSPCAPRLLLTANHPSPLSALRPPQPFIGCGHFSQANAFLRQNGCEPINWWSSEHGSTTRMSHFHGII